MGYERPGERFYPTQATKAVNHGLPCIENGVPGVAIKQQAPPFGTGLSDVANKLIAIAEKFVIDCKGIVEVPNTGISGATKGAPVWITVATNALTLTGPTSAGVTEKFGRVVELAAERKTQAGFLRINLDLRDTFA